MRFLAVLGIQSRKLRVLNGELYDGNTLDQQGIRREAARSAATECHSGNQYVALIEKKLSPATRVVCHSERILT